MDKLTAKQEAFAQAVAGGMTQSDAYRHAYDAGGMSDATIWKRSGELMANGAVAGRVAELKAEIAEKQLWTRENSVKALIGAYKVAKEANNASGMTGAIKELNAMHGYNAPVKVDHTSADGSMTPRPAIDVSKLSTETLRELVNARVADGR